jgi:ABC-type metal ion transport system substrate-binding protein
LRNKKYLQNDIQKFWKVKSVKNLRSKKDIMVQKSRTNFQRGLSYGFLCQNW